MKSNTVEYEGLIKGANGRQKGMARGLGRKGVYIYVLLL
jgi:hypothetical protein